ncbi:hypothetical protein DICVIV_12863 [Dictyocaulus viviparus]|uniref:Uncharacterized protein n=1 Tax=Dictyocaulus viviparus TaxID=29172 RepID=A0A0D8XBM3_DICVI|nr:hypothetical protein DICVIV_12863 [Dictyocaulus viviparus]
MLNQASPDNSDTCHVLSDLLNDVRENTKCSCSPMDVGQCDDSTHGFTISVVIIRKMMLDITECKPDNIRDVARHFTEALRERQNRGQCNDDLLVVLSADDNVVR